MDIVFNTAWPVVLYRNALHICLTYVTQAVDPLTCGCMRLSAEPLYKITKCSKRGDKEGGVLEHGPVKCGS